MADEFDPGAYLDSVTAVQEPDLPEVKPRRLTFYYPETPERTRAAGLSYSMEGGIHGGPGFSDLDLRNHTLEKFKEGKSDFVAVAMHGKPTGDLFRMVVEGTPIIAKNVDTGGGLIPGQTDIATSNPALARGGGYGGSGGVIGGEQAPQAPVPMEPIDFTSPEPEKKRRAAPIAATPAPTPKFPVDETQPLNIPSPALPTQIGQATPPIQQAPMPQFDQAVQEATLNPPPESLMASNAPFDPAAYLASQTPTPAPTPTQTPVAAFDPATYLAEQTSRSEVLPTPTPISAEGEPGLWQKAVRGVGHYVGEMIPPAPESFKQGFQQASGIDMSDPFSMIGTVIPQLKQPINEAFHAIHRIQQIQEADQTPPWSQQRFDAGIGTALDLLNLGTIGGGIKAGARAARAVERPSVTAQVASTREVPVPESLQPRAPNPMDVEVRRRQQELKSGGVKPSEVAITPEKLGYTPAVKSTSGRIFTGGTHEEAIANMQRSGGSSTLAPNGRGWMSQDGQYMTLLEVARNESRPEPQLPEPLNFSVDMPSDTFATEHHPVSSALHEMKVMSKSGAKRAKKYKGNEALWDDLPVLSHPTHNKIYSPHGEMPDVAAQNLYDAGLISEPSVDRMWAEVAKESKSARSTMKAQRTDAKAVGAAAKTKFAQDTAFNKAEQAAWKGGEPAVPVKDLQVGDTVKVGGEDFKVTDIDPDTFDVTLEDGSKYGVQSVSDKTVIYGKHSGAGATTAPPSPPAATPPPIPPPPAPKPPPVPTGADVPNRVRGSGPFWRSYKIDKRLGEIMDAIGAAPEHGAILAETKHSNLTDGLTTAQSTDLFRYLLSERLKIENPKHPQILSGLESLAIERDPAIAKALNYYRKEIEPEVEAWHKRAGTSEKSIAGKRGKYIALIPKTDVLIGENLAIRKVSRMSRTTRFAKAASGLAQEYSVNGKDILRESYVEPIRKAMARELYDTAERKGVAAPSPQFMPDPLNGPNAGKWVQVVKDTDLPENIQYDLGQIIKNTAAPEGAEKWLREYQKFATGIALTANPAELLNHMRRQLNLVSAKPPIGQGLMARLEALVPYFGPKIGTAKRAIMMDMSLPENQKMLAEITGAGGGSTRAFYERYHSNIPGLKQAQSWSNELLFGIPKGKGIKGWDLRMRMVLEKIRRAAEPSLAHDPQRMRENANQIGEYGSQVSWPVRALRAINPYAATTLRMRATELKTALGLHGFQGGTVPKRALHWAETQLRGTGGTIITLATANKLMTGKWPWENDKGHEFDLGLPIHDKDGKRIYLKLRAIAPELSRPVSSLSIPDLLRERGAQHPQYASAAATGPANQVASLLSSPGLNLALAAGPQVAPYFMREPGEQGMNFMETGRLSAKERKEGKSAELRRLQSVLSTLNPFGEIFGPDYHVEVPGALGYLEEPVPGVKPFGHIFTTSYEKKNKSDSVSQYFK